MTHPHVSLFRGFETSSLVEIGLGGGDEETRKALGWKPRDCAASLPHVANEISDMCPRIGEGVDCLIYSFAFHNHAIIIY